METSRRKAIPDGQHSRVLVIDDDRHLLAALHRGLSLAGLEVTPARNAGEALGWVEKEWPEVIVLDILMPGLDGLHLCRVIRDRSSVPILMLTALDSVPDRVAGLQAGADDYLVKPFALDELLARIHALVRRAGSVPFGERLTYADLTLDPATWSVIRGGVPISLTAVEFRLLERLVRFQGRVLTREHILDSIWGEDTLVESNVVDAHILNLRKKLESGERSRLIKTVRGVGYVLRED